MPVATDEDRQDRDEELPTIVVLNNGDLTAEEAAAFQAEKEKGKAVRDWKNIQRIFGEDEACFIFRIKFSFFIFNQLKIPSPDSY